MTNQLALCLVFTSLFAAKVWSPSPVVKQGGNQVEDVIEKEGHRVIVVETYDQDGQHNTKVSISPEQPQEGKTRGTSDHGQEAQFSGEKHRARELICDALGQCTEKIAKVIDKAKGKASEKAQQVVDQEKEMVREAKERAQERVHGAKQTVEDAYERVRESVAHKAKEVKETTKQKAKEAVQSVSDKGKTIGKDETSEMSDEVNEAKEKAAEKAKEASKHARNWFTRAVRYVTSHETMAASMSVLNLLGFAIAYGTCIWITFVSSYVLARALPKQQFGLVQSKMYPVYFSTMAYSIGLALLAHLMGQRKLLFTHKAQMLQAFNLMAAIVLVLVNLFYMEPLATKTMFERLKIEKEEGRGRESLSTEETGKGDVRQPVADPSVETETTRSREEPPPSAVSDKAEERQQERIRSRVANINNRLRTLNSYSSLLNILTLMALTWHLVYLGNCLHVHEAC